MIFLALIVYMLYCAWSVFKYGTGCGLVAAFVGAVVIIALDGVGVI